ncbi:MAG: serine/threonine protein kinase [Phycisphaeraceae bacterium]|nr:serine/threonine protein kinase [Phycisphaeraceae bacterium]MCB9848736.1 serine/threonine protein kinase [Phycisphaeraceae bacterium]
MDEQSKGGDPPSAESVEEAETAIHESAGIHGSVSPIASAPRPSDTISGRTIGRYKLLQRIGEGGFGEVWMAEQREPVTRRVALKIIKLGMDTNHVIARFEAERQALAMMDHPNIAKVFDAGATDSGRPYFVMELVRGISITEYCDKNNMPSRERLRLFVQVCGAVQHAHQKGIIHRDLKPSNVLVTIIGDQPVIKVIDFGIAKATERSLTEQTMFTEIGQFIGTPAYMSPEQADSVGTDIDTRSDIYSLGVLLYELLTGVTPFDIKTLRNAAVDEVKRIIREEEPSKPSTRLSTLGEDLDTVARQRATEPKKLSSLLRGDLDWIVMKAMEKDRSRRYESSNGLARDIERYLANEPVSAGPPSAAYRMRKFARRNRVGVVTGAIIVLALAIGVVVASSGMVIAMRERDRADAAAIAESAARMEAQLQADRANAVNDFLTDDLLGAIDPTRTQDREITMREVVDGASLRIATRFKDQPDTAAAVERTLGDIYTRLGVFPSAKAHFLHAQSLLRESPDSRERDQLEIRSDLLQLQFYEGEYDQGIRNAEEALDVMRDTLGEEDLVTLNTMSVLAMMHTWNNQLDQAEPLFLRALEILERTQEPQSRLAIGVRNNLAVLYSERRELDRALEMLNAVLVTMRTEYGEEDPDTLDTMVNIAHVSNEMGRLDDAEAMGIKALEAARRTLGNEHLTTLNAANNLAVTYARMGELDKAEPLYLEGYEACRKILGPEHSETLVSMANLGRLYMRMERYEDAVRVLTECAALNARVLPPGHFGIGVTLRSLGESQLGLGRPAEALPNLIEAYDVLLPHLGPEDPGMQDLTEKIATASEQTGDAAAAAQWRAKLGE